jgi:carbamoyltransferase
VTKTAQALADQQVVGWFQGRMEFGPRALGARSTLADPRSSAMWETVNLKVKRRESFRPFAPAILAEHLEQSFDLDFDSPYMGFTANVRDWQRPVRDELSDWRDWLREDSSAIPAVTHIDGSARFQTVDASANPRVDALLSAFHRLTGCPVLINTSFNVRGEPIRCTPEDAFRCFLSPDIDTPVVGNCDLEKKGQRSDLVDERPATFALD